MISTSLIKNLHLNPKEVRIAFLGSPTMSARLLETLVNEGFNVVLTIAQPARPKGRGQKMILSEVEEVSRLLNIPCFTPNKIRENYEFIKPFNIDLIVCLAYGQIIPQGLLDIPRLGALNFHGSILPSLRGADPIRRSIIEGYKVSGFSLMEMVDKMDAGQVFATDEIEILDANYDELCDKLTASLLKFAPVILTKFLKGELEGVPQDESKVTFAPKIKKEDEKLNLDLDVESFLRWVRALSYHPGGYLLINGESLKIFEAKFHSFDVSKPVGTVKEVLKDRFILQLKDGDIEVLEVQKANAKRMKVRDFLNGYHHLLNEVLS